MKVLTVYQPRASLVALGVKPIETRSWSTTYRGPLAIHAAKMEPPSADGAIGDWTYQRSTRCLRHVDGRLVHYVPRGAIVATCELIDVVPIIDPDSVPADSTQDQMPPRVECSPSFPDYPDFPDGWLDLYHPTMGSWMGVEEGLSIPNQAPYGDFTHGRFAWLLADIEPVDPPVPFRGGQCLTREWTP